MNVFPNQDAEGLFDLGFMDAPLPGNRHYPDEYSDQPGAAIGRYVLQEALGEGGFGTVWRAAQTEPIRRELALKLIKRGMDSREIIARFSAESQALAMMDHPNIAAVLDAGTTMDGRPFFAMELVKGEPLTTYSDSRRLSIHERIELFIPVCKAVQHAHQKAILHRDLKPSNILVATIDGAAIAKVIDFGIAKAIGKTPETGFQSSLPRTMDGSIMGTPQYMSPEQAGSVKDVDTRSDIYSLGVILYELLTGNPPIQSSSVEGASNEEILLRIRHEEPVKPSANYLNVSSRPTAALRGSDPQRLKRLLRGDLDWIILKALEKDRRRRYETANALAADLDGLLKGRTVSAVAPTWHYQLSKFANRNRLAFTTAGAITISLLAGTGVSLWQAREAKRASLAAKSSQAEAEANYRDAKNAVEQYLSRVTENPKLLEANFQSLRKELLETAIPFYEKHGKRSGKDSQLLSNRAWATGRLAAIAQQTNDSAKAERLFREAIAITESLAGRFPSEPEHKKALTFLYHHLSTALGSLERHAEAAEIQAKGLRVAEDLVAATPTDAGLRFALMSMQLLHTYQLRALGRVEEAVAVTRSAEKLGRGLLAEAPGDPSYRGQFASALSALAGFDHDAGRIEASERNFRDALGIQEKLVKEMSLSWDFRTAFAITNQNLGHLLASHGRGQEAQEFLEKAVRMDRQIVSDYPQMTVPRVSLAGALFNHAINLKALDRREESEAAFRESSGMFKSLRIEQTRNSDYWHQEGINLEQIGILKAENGLYQTAENVLLESRACQSQALALHSDRVNYRASLRSTLKVLAMLQVENGKQAAALSSVEELAALPDANWEDLETSAAALAKNIPPPTAGGEPGDGDEILFAKSRNRVIENLRLACERGYPRILTVKRDPRFESLLDHAPFLELEESAPDPTGISPAGFTFDYSFDDPGKRKWEKIGEEWSETKPSGGKYRLSIVGRLRVAGVSGTEVCSKTDDKLFLFIPDRGTPSPAQLMFRLGKTDWASLGPIGDLR